MAKYKIKKTDLARYEDLLTEKYWSIENGNVHYDEGKLQLDLATEHLKYKKLHDSIDARVIAGLSAGGIGLGYGFKAPKLSLLLTVPAAALLAKKMYYRVRMNMYARLTSIDSKEHVFRKDIY